MQLPHRATPEVTIQLRNIVAESWVKALRNLKDDFQKTDLLAEAYQSSPHFHSGSIEYALDQFILAATKESMLSWLGKRVTKSTERVSVLNASNIPLVGLRDLLAVSLMGHSYTGVLSSRSKILLPRLVSHLKESLPDLKFDIEFCSFDKALIKADRLIATGSDQTIISVKERCAQHGIRGPQCLFRGHKIGAGVISEIPTQDQLMKLSEDVLLHDGRGCRSIAILFVPSNFKMKHLVSNFEIFRTRYNASKSCAEALIVPSAYYMAIDCESATGNGFLITSGPAAEQIAGHLRIVRYQNIEKISSWITENREKVQHLASNLDLPLMSSFEIEEFGSAQNPKLSWDPDGLDVIDWLATS